MRSVIVCDSMSAYGGAERVIEQLIHIFPQSDIFTTVDVLAEGDRGFLGDRKVQSSFLQKFPRVRQYYRKLLPLWPLAVEDLDVSAYDLIISSHHSVAYGVLTRPGQVHVSYVHSPMRYAWDLQHEYLRESNLDHGVAGFLARCALHRSRVWDFAAAQRPDAMAANSHFVAERLRRTHRRDAQVIHPPVAVENFAPVAERDDYYISVGRLVPYKRIDLLARAFAAMPGRRLKIIGDGPARKKIEALAGPNVEVLGHLPDAEVKAMLSRARAFLYAGIEDFGIAAVEAQASGVPVIAYRGGGLAETVLDIDQPRPTGLLFDDQGYEAVCEAVEEFEAMLPHFTPANCIANAARFTAERFRREFETLVEEALATAAPRHRRLGSPRRAARLPSRDFAAEAGRLAPGTPVPAPAE